MSTMKCIVAMSIMVLGPQDLLYNRGAAKPPSILSCLVFADHMDSGTAKHLANWPAQTDVVVVGGGGY